jgi:hypothetical protein
VRDDDVDDTVIRPRRDPPALHVRDEDVDDTVVRPHRDWSAAPDIGDTVIRPGRAAPASGYEDDGGPDPADTIIRPPRGGPQSRGTGAPVTGRVGDTTAMPVVPPLVPVSERRVASIRLRERVVPLDRPVVIGRRPVGPRIPRGLEPLMLAVPSPTGQVSGTHVTIRSEGSAVVVEDARSTNGTFVRVPGAAPLRMRAGATMVVLTGTVVDIGDGNVIEIMSPHLRLRPDAVGPGTLDPDTGFPAAHPGMGFPDAERPTP